MTWKITSYNGQRGPPSTCGNLYVVKRNWVLRRFHCSESVVVLHFVYWMSSFWVWCCFCLFWGLFLFRLLKTSAFCISPVLLQPENSWPTTRRFDDRQSLERAWHELNKNEAQPEWQVKRTDLAVDWQGCLSKTTKISYRHQISRLDRGMCYADTLQVWFPAHWAFLVIRQLQRKEDEYRRVNPSWAD